MRSSPLVVVEVEFDCNKNNNSKREFYYDFKNANYDLIMNDLNNINWDSILKDHESMESNTQGFYDVVNSIIQKHIERKYKRESSHPCWYDKAAINLKNRVNRMHKKAKKHNSPSLRLSYIELRRQFRDHLKEIYQNYKMSIQQMIMDDPSNLYRHVNSSRKQVKDLPNSMSLGDLTADTPGDIAELFGLFFQYVYTEPCVDSVNKFDQEYTTKYYIRDVCSIIPNVAISEDLISQSIKNIPENLVMGPDNIPNIFIKRCAKLIITPITWLLKSSLEKKKIPLIWKQSFIRPIFKSGKKSLVDNYRGVAVQCTIPKLLDSIVAKHINEYTNNIMTHHQHGFIRGRSTVTNLMEFTSMITNGMRKHRQVDAIYLDVSKAFDSIDTPLMFHKLNIMGLNDQILEWLAEYFNGRQQIVKIDEATQSGPINVTSGVGQGYPIGAVLFNLFLYDFPFHFKNAVVHLYADDAKISLPVDVIADCTRLQDELNGAILYFKINKLKLNVSKTKSISYSRRTSTIQCVYYVESSPIEKVSFIKDLRVILDERLSFKQHLDFVIGRAKSVLAWIKRFSYEFDDPWVVKRLFEAFALPVLEYGSHTVRKK